MLPWLNTINAGYRKRRKNNSCRVKTMSVCITRSEINKTAQY